MATLGSRVIFDNTPRLHAVVSCEKAKSGARIRGEGFVYHEAFACAAAGRPEL